MSITLEALTKRYEGTPVVSAVSLEIREEELFVLLGPSGSGKSTLLRMIAGLVEPDSGRILLHGRDVTAISPKDRGVGFVFQHYALFRNLTVGENVEFSLRVRRVPDREARRRREELLEMVGLSGFAGRLPGQLSGGQQQRVALARALASNPSVLLLDEPFGALDAKIRVELRQTLRRIQRELGFTAVFVTHDQEEAFELGDRVGVMHLGSLLEVGPPSELYLHPRSPFVAGFLGVANLLVGVSTADAVRLGRTDLPLGPVAAGGASQRVQVLFRPEDIELSPAEAALRSSPLGRGVVEERAFVGAFERLRVRVDQPADVRQISPTPSFGSGLLRLEVTRTQPEALLRPLRSGDATWVGMRRAHVLAPVRIDTLLLREGGPAQPTALRYATDLAERLGGAVRAAAAGEPQTEEERTAPHRAAAAAEPESLDILVVGAEPDGEIPAGVFELGEPHHLLVVGEPVPPPDSILVCVAVGEPAKVDVRVAERLAWRLHARVSVLTVLPESERDRVPDHVRHFLEASVRDLASRGIEADHRIRHGAAATEIRAEQRESGHGLTIVGAPLRTAGPRPARPSGVVGRLLVSSSFPILIVRGEGSW